MSLVARKREVTKLSSPHRSMANESWTSLTSIVYVKHIYTAYVFDIRLRAPVI